MQVTVPGLTVEIDALQHIEIAVGHVEIADGETAAFEPRSVSLPWAVLRGWAPSGVSSSLTSAKSAGDTRARPFVFRPAAIVDIVDQVGQRHGDDEIEHAGQQQW